MGSRETPSSCSKALETLNLETSDSSSPDSPVEEQWPNSSPDLKEEDSVDVVLEDSEEPLCPSSPPTGREIIRYEVKVNQRSIEDICLGCGTLQVYAPHPLFEGGICAECKDKFLETLFLYDEDGHQSYCTICCSGDTLFICESPDCTRCYCFECVDILVGPGTSERINAMACWVCFLCLPFSRSGLLQRRKKWRHLLKAFHDREGASSVEIYKTVSAWKRQPVRVLSLFGNIDKELKSLGFRSHSEGGTLKYVEDVTNVVRRDVEKWGPFDLVYGSTQPLGYSCDHCPGWYMFQFHRILQYARPRQESQQPFFWIFMDNLLLTEDDQATTVRFLQTEAVTLQEVRGRVLQNAVRVWSNIPGLKRGWAYRKEGDARYHIFKAGGLLDEAYKLQELEHLLKHAVLTPKEEESLQAQVKTRSKLATQKVDPLVKICLLPLREYFKYFSQNSLPL